MNYRELIPFIGEEIYDARREEQKLPPTIGRLAYYGALNIGVALSIMYGAYGAATILMDKIHSPSKLEHLLK